MKRKLYCGVGINDADYPVSPIVNGKRQYCPFYITWRNMLTRVYSGNRVEYENVTVCENWLKFSNFKKWMELQDWEGNHLDKDLLVKGNKVYCPESCIFVSRKVNNFLLERGRDRGTYPIGVYWDNTRNCFNAQISNDGKLSIWYNFKTPEEAHERWLIEKLKLAKLLASKQKDFKISNALIKRYENYRGI